MTTNAGSEASSSSAGFSSSRHDSDKERTEKALSSFLRPEFINRVDEIITFNRLTKDNFAEIVKLMLNDLVKALSEKDIKLVYSEKAAKAIAESSYSEKYGARNMRRYIEKEVEDKLADKLISGYSENIFGISLDHDGEKLTVETI